MRLYFNPIRFYALLAFAISMLLVLVFAVRYAMAIDEDLSWQADLAQAAYILPLFVAIAVSGGIWSERLMARRLIARIYKGVKARDITSPLFELLLADDDMVVHAACHDETSYLLRISFRGKTQRYLVSARRIDYWPRQRKAVHVFSDFKPSDPQSLWVLYEALAPKRTKALLSLK